MLWKHNITTLKVQVGKPQEKKYLEFFHFHGPPFLLRPIWSDGWLSLRAGSADLPPVAIRYRENFQISQSRHCLSAHPLFCLPELEKSVRQYFFGSDL